MIIDLSNNPFFHAPWSIVNVCLHGPLYQSDQLVGLPVSAGNLSGHSYKNKLSADQTNNNYPSIIHQAPMQTQLKSQMDGIILGARLVI